MRWSLSMWMVGRGDGGELPPQIPSWPSRRSPRRRPGEGSGGGGGGWAACPRCRHPPCAGPVSRRGSVGMAVSGVGAEPMHPVPSTPCPAKPVPRSTLGAPSFLPLSLRASNMEPFCPSLLGHVPSCRDRCCPGPDLAAPWAAHPCRGTWSLSSSSPSVAMLPEGFFRGGLERRRTRLTLSRITWMQTGGQPQSHTQAAPPVSSPQSARTCRPLPCPLGGHWADSGDSTSAGHSRHSQVTKGCWGDPSSSHCLLLGIPRCGGCNSPLRWPRTEPPPWGALPLLCTSPTPTTKTQPRRLSTPHRHSPGSPGW